MELITVIAELGGHYLHLFKPKNGTGYEIASWLFELIHLYDSMDSIKAIGGDGTASNTGIHGGAFRWTEVMIGRPLQWVVCLLHYVELPMNHLLTLHTGQTKGPRSREGSLASQFYNLKHELMVDFTRISGKV